MAMRLSKTIKNLFWIQLLFLIFSIIITSSSFSQTNEGDEVSLSSNSITNDMIEIKTNDPEEFSTNNLMDSLTNEGMDAVTNEGIGSMTNEGMDSLTNEGIGSMTNEGTDSLTNEGMDSMTNEGMDSLTNEGMDAVTNFPTETETNILTNFRTETPIEDKIEKQIPIEITRPIVKQKEKKIYFYDAGWRSAILPSWGQFYKKQNTKGYLIASIQFVFLSTTIGSYIHYNNLANDYMQDPTDRKYDTLNQWLDVNHTTFVLSLLCYLYNVADALVTQPPQFGYSSGNNISQHKFSIINKQF